VTLVEAAAKALDSDFKMKITKDQLRNIIKEEISDRDKDTMNDVIAELKKAVQAHKSQHERLQAILDRLVDSEGD
jgi:hypothetical protein